MSTVNIVMATYNGENYLREQMESILNSSYTDWSLYIFDDGSTDMTVDIAREYESKFPERIKVYQNEKNLGCTSNFLSGLKTVYDNTKKEDGQTSSLKLEPSTSNQAKYFMFCDQDDVWLRDKIGITLERMKFLEKKYGKEKPFVVFTDAQVVSDKLELVYHSFYRSQCLTTCHTDLAHMLMENKCIGCTMMMNIPVVNYLKELPSKVRYHDWWMGLIAAAFGYISFVSTPTIKYRQHGKNQVGSMKFSKYVKLRMKSVSDQKKRLMDCEMQGIEFLKLYEKELSEEQKKLLLRFSSLSKSSFMRKRYLLVRYHFLKSGLVRNLGLFIVI